MTTRLDPEESFLTLCLGGAVAATVLTVLVAFTESLHQPGWLAVAAVAIALWFFAALGQLWASKE